MEYFPEWQNILMENWRVIREDINKMKLVPFHVFWMKTLINHVILLKKIKSILVGIKKFAI